MWLWPAKAEDFLESSKLLDSLRSSLDCAAGSAKDIDVQTLTDLSAERHRGAGVWEFLSIAGGRAAQ
jgi:hypothetical protein